ncbi:hypothetical protein RFI_12753 [Reticulomyxa filosa]|uniref:ELMO domain-containing protein n=1 Tax=Reticulomyxa filosa TaxID=46433 RepID=X6NGE3_RETFI|nr:hypothetical protein RFI_12753 [Reticulomyxa filosa]|eukprot:ETO24407.1 hypothetical protein RFI_12753 [Reticulomyxa filosa]
MVWQLLYYFRRSKSYQSIYQTIVTTPNWEIETIGSKILEAKQIPRPAPSSTLWKNLRQFLLCIRSWNEIIDELYKASKERFNKKNLTHNHLLTQFWDETIGKYEKELEKNKKMRKINLESDPRWEVVGFQGKSPESDFRGLDLLGLRAMLWFGRTYTKYSKSVLYYTHKYHYTNNWFCYYVTGINLMFGTFEFLTGYPVNVYVPPSSHSLDFAYWNASNELACNWYLQEFAMKKDGVFLKRCEYLREYEHAHTMNGRTLNESLNDSKQEEEEEHEQEEESYSQEFFQHFKFDCQNFSDLKLSVASQFFTALKYNQFGLLIDRNENDDVRQEVCVNDDSEIIRVMKPIYNLASYLFFPYFQNISIGYLLVCLFFKRFYVQLVCSLSSIRNQVFLAIKKSSSKNDNYFSKNLP